MNVILVIFSYQIKNQRREIIFSKQFLSLALVHIVKYLFLLCIITLSYSQNTALDLDGSNDYIQIADDNSLDINSSISLSAWIFPTNIANKDGILAKRTSTENSGDWALRFTSTAKLKLLIWDGNASNGSTSSNSSISTNTWTHIALTHDNSTSTTKFYINGLLDATSTSLSKNLAGNNSIAYIGWDGQQGDKFFAGKIDEIRFWDDIRTQTEIKANMHTELSGSESNLVAYYNFNDGSGTTLTDLTSNSNNGTMTNMANDDWVSNSLFAQDYALDFDGSNDHVVISNPYTSFSNSLSVEFWVNTSTSTTGPGIGQASANSDNMSTNVWLMHMNHTGSISFYVNDTGSWRYVTSTSRIDDGDWHHIAGTINSSKITIYVDGIEEASSNVGISSGITSNSSANIHFGKDVRWASNRFVNGKIDEVRIWDDVRTQAEIQNNMFTELVGTESNLVAYYNFNDGRGVSVLDLTSNNNNGTMTNMDASSDWTSSKILGTSITGNSGFRMLSSPVSGQVLGSLLTNLWTQGMTGADITTATANVWTLNVSGQSWTALSDISTSGTSLSAGQGFLVYVFEDTDNDGTADLPAVISVSGTENSGNATISSIPANAWVLAGNPYSSTIDWDLIAADNSPFFGTTYIWDDGSSAYKSWNGSAGGLTDGLIAPYQSFWVQNTYAPNQTLTISESHKSGQSGTLYRISSNQELGSIIFEISSFQFSDQTFISFQDEAEAGLDKSDGLKLFPLNHSDRLVAISYADDIGLDINNLPYDNRENILIPFDIIKLQLDNNAYMTQEEEITFSWDISNLPDHISLRLIDQLTNIETDMHIVSSIIFTTQPKGSFSTNYSGPVGTYPLIGEARFSLAVSYDALTGGNIKVIPTEFALHAAYPNPFNPSTTISFDLPENGKVSLSVYDIKGALVGTLLNESKVAGTYQYKWTPNSELASGTYLLELKTNNKTKHQKITYIK